MRPWGTMCLLHLPETPLHLVLLPLSSTSDVSPIAGAQLSFPFVEVFGRSTPTGKS